MIPYFDACGFIDLRPLKKAPPRAQDILARMYRFLFVKGVCPAVSESYWKKPLERDYQMPPREELKKMMENERAAFGKLSKAASDGARIVAQALHFLQSGKAEKARALARDIIEVDRRIEIAGLSNPELSPIVRLFAAGKANLGDRPPAVMLQQAKMLYTEAEAASAAMERMAADLAGE